MTEPNVVCQESSRLDPCSPLCTLAFCQVAHEVYGERAGLGITEVAKR